MNDMEEKIDPQEVIGRLAGELAAAVTRAVAAEAMVAKLSAKLGENDEESK